MTRDLQGRVALVTGGGRARGIGAATALALAEAGAVVVVTDLARSSDTMMAGAPTVAQDDSHLRQVVAAIESLGGEALGLAMDVADEDEVVGVVDAALDRFGQIDIVFNNAGTPLGARPFLELTNEDWAVSWDVNVMGMVYVCRHVIPHMQRNGGGAIVNTSSVAGLIAYPSYGAYTATKHAVIGLTKALALDHGRDGIRVNAVCPGDIKTQMGDVATQVAADTQGVAASALSDAALAAHVGLGRRGLPEEVAQAVVWLASDAASFVNGVALRVDGADASGL